MVLFTKSNDGGRSFSEPVTIDENGRFVNSLNVEVSAYDEQFSYVAAQVSVSGNEEILLLEMTGNNSTKVLNLSNNPKISECPSIAIEGDNIYVVWEDMTPGNHEILTQKAPEASNHTKLLLIIMNRINGNKQCLKEPGTLNRTWRRIVV